MKKKILALCLVVALLATAIAGATLAYFTDTDEAKNVMTVGNLSIELKEEGKIVDQNGKEYDDKLEGDEDAGYTYKNLVPGDQLTKIPTITNDDSYDAYVRAVVTVNNAFALHKAIDQYYEGKGLTDAEMQPIYDEVFNGWHINHDPRPAAHGANDARGIIEYTDAKILKVDFTKTAEAGSTQGHSLFGITNWFKSELEEAATTYEIRPNGAFAGYYTNGMADGEIRYVYYIDLASGESVDLFQGLNVPKDFTNDQMAMFKDMNIDIKVAAIQQDGFATPQDAFAALQEAIPIE